MNQRLYIQQLMALFAAVLLLVIAIMVVVQPNLLSNIQIALNPPSAARESAVAAFDYDAAADNMAFRWQAMAEFYEKHGMLTRDSFDYEAAADNMAYRWQAMARFYDEHDLLTREYFDYEAAADNMAFRWQAMAEFYEKHGLLNERTEE